MGRAGGWWFAYRKLGGLAENGFRGRARIWSHLCNSVWQHQYVDRHSVPGRNRLGSMSASAGSMADFVGPGVFWRCAGVAVIRYPGGLGRAAGGILGAL